MVKSSKYGVSPIFLRLVKFYYRVFYFDKLYFVVFDKKNNEKELGWVVKSSKYDVYPIFLNLVKYRSPSEVSKWAGANWPREFISAGHARIFISAGHASLYLLATQEFLYLLATRVYICWPRKYIFLLFLPLSHPFPPFLSHPFPSPKKWPGTPCVEKFVPRA